MLENRYGLPRSMLFQDLDRLGFHLQWRPEHGRVISTLGHLPRRITILSDAVCLLGEALLISPKLSLPITDPNHGTIRLLIRRILGVQLLNKLLDEGAIEFLHGEQRYAAPENAEKYNRILQDVEQCVSRGIEGEEHISERERKTLVSRAIRNSIVCDGGNIAQFVLKHDVDLYEQTNFSKSLRQLQEENSTSKGVAETVEVLLRLESIPSIRHLIDDRKLTIRQAAELRWHPGVEEFRRWLWDRPNPASSAEVLKQYQEVILKQSSAPDQSAVARAIRITGVSLAGSAVGTAIGLAVAGPPGMVFGAAAGLGISLLDGFSDKIQRKSNPRRFATVLHNQVMVNEMGGTRLP